MKKLLICLLLLLMASCALAEAPDMADLAVLAQTDPMLADETFYYSGMPLRASGCGPLSIINAINACLGVTDKEQAIQITDEMLCLLTMEGTQTSLTFDYLQQLSSVSRYAYPTLFRLLDKSGVVITYMNRLPPMDKWQALVSPNANSRLLITSNNEVNRYNTLCTLAYELYHSGHRDATVAITFLAAGTPETSGAFRSSSYGHYISLFIPVDEFCSDGALYLLDSYPRCLANETPGVNYLEHYDFAVDTYENQDLQPFARYCRISRRSDTVLCIKPTNALQRPLRDFPPAEALSDYEQYLTTMGFVNEGKLIIHIPGTPAD